MQEKNLNNFPKQSEVVSTNVLTEIQNENLKIMNVLSEIYPKAFTEGTDSKGRNYLILDINDSESYDHNGRYESRYHTVICQNGIIRIITDNLGVDNKGNTLNTIGFRNHEFDLAPIIDGESNKGFTIRIFHKINQEYTPTVSLRSMTNFRDLNDNNLKDLKKKFTKAEEANAGSKLSVEEILGLL
jgi:hypothetical protein